MLDTRATRAPRYHLRLPQRPHSEGDDSSPSCPNIPAPVSSNFDLVPSTRQIRALEDSITRALDYAEKNRGDYELLDPEDFFDLNEVGKSVPGKTREEVSQLWAVCCMLCPRNGVPGADARCVSVDSEPVDRKSLARSPVFL